MLRGDRHSYLFREDILKSAKYHDQNHSYNFMKEFYLGDPILNQIPERWKELESKILNKPKKLNQFDQTHQRANKQTDSELLELFAPLFKECIHKEFIQVYYNIYHQNTLSFLIQAATEIANIPNNYKNEETKADLEKIKDFFDLFSITMISFQQHNFAKLKELETWEDKSYKTTLHQRLKEQYHVLRHIWGDNGELKEEDITYYKWMHYKNLSDMHSSSFLGKFKPWIRRVLYEGVFGWGVQLPRIVLSTLGMVVIFTAIYYFMFQADPSLDVQWDGAPLKGPIDVWKSFVFAIQTTFSAGLGDWAPIGSGPIKIPMTINAVLGLLFVTFLIGAYGRKMLR